MNRNNGREIGERLNILRDYLIKNADRDHAVRLQDMQKHPANAGFDGTNGVELDKKTIYRDLEALRTIFNLDIAYAEKFKGYILHNPPFEAGELRLIVDSIQASKYITQNKAKALTEKIIKHFGNANRQDLNRKAYVYNRIRSQNDNVMNEADRIHEAIAADRKIGFLYFHMRPDRKKEYSNGGKHIVVSPYALYWNDGNLYLYAFDGRIFRFYRVDRMERISRPRQEERDGKELFDEKNLTSQKAKIFQMYSGKEYTVKMRFLNTLTDSVTDQFGRDLVMIPDDKNHFTIIVPVEVSPPFYAWVASFERRAKIISPPEVVEGMKSFLQKASDMYKDDGNT